MASIVIATVTLVWALTVAVATLAWLAGSILGARSVARVFAVAHTLRAEIVRERIPTSAPSVSIRTPAEFRAYRAARDAKEATLPAAQRPARVKPSDDTLAAWAANNRGLRLPTDVEPTIVDRAPPAALNASPDAGSDLDALVSLPCALACAESVERLTGRTFPGTLATSVPGYHGVCQHDYSWELPGCAFPRAALRAPTGTRSYSVRTIAYAAPGGSC